MRRVAGCRIASTRVRSTERGNQAGDNDARAATPANVRRPGILHPVGLRAYARLFMGLNKPNPEQLEKLRIRIAELSGWKMLPRDKWLHKGDPKKRHPSGKIASLLRGELATEIPNYPEDLNACHEAEGALLKYEEDHYEHFIDRLEEIETELPIVFAEAWQRCIAMDRTLSEVPIL